MLVKYGDVGEYLALRSLAAVGAIASRAWRADEADAWKSIILPPICLTILWPVFKAATKQDSWVFGWPLYGLK